MSSCCVVSTLSSSTVTDVPANQVLLGSFCSVAGTLPTETSPQLLNPVFVSVEAGIIRFQWEVYGLLLTRLLVVRTLLVVSLLVVIFPDLLGNRE